MGLFIDEPRCPSQFSSHVTNPRESRPQPGLNDYFLNPLPYSGVSLRPKDLKFMPDAKITMGSGINSGEYDEAIYAFNRTQVDAMNYPQSEVAHSLASQTNLSLLQPSSSTQLSTSNEDVSKSFESVKRVQQTGSTPKRPRLTSTSKTKVSNDAEGQPVAKKPRVKAPKESGSGGKVAKITASAKEGKDGMKPVGRAKRKTVNSVSEGGSKVEKNEDGEEVSLAKTKKPKASGTAKPRTTRTLIAGQPKWTVPKKLLAAFAQMDVSSSPRVEPQIRPTVWASSKEELSSALPELTKAANGVSWAMSAVPVLVFEEHNAGLNISKVQVDKIPSVELTMTRDFACMASDLAVRQANLHDVGIPPESSMTPSAARKEAFNHDRPESQVPVLNPPRKTQVGIYVINTVKPNDRVREHYNFDSLFTFPQDPVSNDDKLLITEHDVSMFHAPTIPHDDYSGSYPLNNPHYANNRTYAPSQSDPRLSPEYILLKRGPDDGAKLDEFPSKRVKLEQMDVPLSGLTEPFLPATQPPQLMPSKNRDAYENILQRPNIPQSDSGPQFESMLRTYTPNYLPETIRPSLQPTKKLPSGLKFTKVKVEPRESPIPVIDKHSVSNLTITALPVLPFGRPALQQGFSAIDEPQRAPSPELPLTSPSRRFPTIFPPEVQVLLDHYVSGTPILAIASHSILLERFGVALPPELAYAFLGYFRVQRVWESESMRSLSPGGSTQDYVTGQVEWRFRCDWVASDDSPEAWWAPPRGKGKGRAKNDFDDESDTESNSIYRALRMEHPNYKYRNIPDVYRFPSVLPIHIRATDSHGFPDSMFPLGWHCANCGKLNYRSMLRHRTCSSSYCKDIPSPHSYALPLHALRESQQKSPVPQPYDTYPKGVDGRMTRWDDDMRTYTYILSGDADETVTVKHVFTCNSETLQGEATELLRAFQLDVPLQRKIGKPTFPYFEFEFTDGAGSKILSSPPTTTWENTPPCVMQAKECLIYGGQGYGEKPELTINTLSVLAWVTSGTKKGVSPFPSKVNSIVIMCLGADTVISLIPKSGFPNPPEPVVVNSTINNGNPVLRDNMDVDIPVTSNIDALKHTVGTSTPPIPTENPAVQDQDNDLMNEDGATPIGEIEVELDTGSVPTKSRAAAKPAKPALSITLVHGDLLILSGDDFEYSIKRSGTTILLIGS